MDPTSPLKPLTGERLQALLLAVGASPDSSKKRLSEDIEVDYDDYLSGEDLVEASTPSSKRVDRPFNYACKHCSKSFKRRSDRERHERTHTGERPYKCSYCHKGFIQSSALSNHERIHTGDKPFICGINGCPRDFSDSSSVARHRKSHADRPRHVCELCPGKSYARRDALDRHLAKDHPLPTRSESPSQ